MNISEINGYLRLDHNKITIFWHLNNYEKLIHGHDDIGSFVLFNKGQMIILDSGRDSYLKKNCISSSAHNSITINSLGSMCLDSTLNFINRYKKNSTEYSYKIKGERFELTIKSYGFQRLYRPVVWERMFLLQNNSLFIKDIFTTKSQVEITSYFHLAPKIIVKIEDKALLLLKNKKMSINILSTNESAITASSERFICREGFVSSQYGSKEKNLNLIFKKNIRTKTTILYEVNW